MSDSGTLQCAYICTIVRNRPTWMRYMLQLYLHVRTGIKYTYVHRIQGNTGTHV